MIDLGASEAPAVLGVSPYETPWHLWARKLNLIPEREPDEVMATGLELEGLIAWRAALRLGYDPAAHAMYLPSPASRRYHPTRTWQRATPDVAIETADGIGLIEVKCVIGHPPTTPRVDWLVQVQHQLMVYEDAAWCLLECFGALRTLQWIVQRHPRAQAVILRAEERFLDLVKTETPPPAGADDAHALHHRWPLVGDAMLATTPDDVALDREWAEAERRATAAQLDKERVRARVMERLGPIQEAQLPTGVRWTWRKTKSGVRPLRRWQT